MAKHGAESAKKKKNALTTLRDRGRLARGEEPEENGDRMERVELALERLTSLVERLVPREEEDGESTALAMPRRRGGRRQEHGQQSIFGAPLTEGHLSVSDAMEAMDVVAALLSRLCAPLSNVGESSQVRAQALAELEEYAEAMGEVIAMAQMPALDVAEAVVFGRAGQGLMKLLSPDVRAEHRHNWERLGAHCLGQGPQPSSRVIISDPELPQSLQGTVWPRLDANALADLDDPWEEMESWMARLATPYALQRFLDERAGYEAAFATLMTIGRAAALPAPKEDRSA